IFLFCTCDQLLTPWCVPAGLVYDSLYARREADLCCGAATEFRKKGTKKTASGNECSACGGCPEMIHYELLKSGISPEVSAGPVLAHRAGFLNLTFLVFLL